MKSSVLSRRTILLLCVVCISASALAANVDWVGGNPAGPTLWNVTANWSAGRLPTTGDLTRFLGTADFAEVVDGDNLEINTARVCWGNDNAHIKINAGGSLTTGQVQLALFGGGTGLIEIDGGTMQSSVVRIGRYGTTETAPLNDGTILVNSGTYTVTGNVALGEGPHNGAYYPGIARIIMNGGTMNVGGDLNAVDDLGGTRTVVNVLIDLNDGVLETGGLNGGFIAKTDKTIDIDFGTWIIDGDVTTELAAFETAGQLVGFGGAGTINYDYDVTNSGKTTVTATHPMNPEPEHKSIIQVNGGTVVLSWDNIVEPNTPGGTVTADVWFGTDPNKFDGNYIKVVDGLDVTGVARSSSTPQAIAADTTYYWQVDFHQGGGSTIEGPVFEFLAINNTQPQLTVQNVTGWLEPDNTPEGVFEITAETFSSVVDDTAGIEYAWTIDPADDPNIVFSSTTVENPTITVAAAGTWTVTLTVKDGYWTESASGVLSVSDNACQAARLMPDYAGNPVGDVTDDCIVDILDLAVLAENWLESTRHTGTVLY